MRVDKGAVRICDYMSVKISTSSPVHCEDVRGAGWRASSVDVSDRRHAPTLLGGAGGWFRCLTGVLAYAVESVLRAPR